MGESIAPSDLSSRPWAARLALRCRLDSSKAKGRMRSETIFQWSGEGGLMLSALFWPCFRPWGSFSNLYSSVDRCPHLGIEGKRFGESTPLQVAGSRQYGV